MRLWGVVANGTQAWTIFGFVTVVLQVQYGIGRHWFYLGEENTIQAMKWNQLARLTFVPSMALLKTSICFFLLRILDPRTHPHFRAYIWLVMAASVVTNIVLLIVWSIQCIPLDAVWDPRIEEKFCLSQSVVVDIAYLQAGFNLVTDILCALFPMFFFNTAYMRWRTKGALIMLVLLGIITSVTALLRVVYLHELEEIDDPTWNLTNVTICALIETKAGIFLTCLPAIKCLWTEFVQLLPWDLGATRNGSKTWDVMESPILPALDTSSFAQPDPRDLVPLRTISRESARSKAYDEPPPTPGLDGAPMVKVTTWI